MRTLIGAGEELNGLYYFKEIEPARIDPVTCIETRALWHQRLGHLSDSALKFLAFVSKPKIVEPCDTCFCAKQTHESFSISPNNAFEIFSLIHCDIWGPYTVKTHNGARYSFAILDDYSCALWIFLMNEKSEVQTILPRFCKNTQLISNIN